MSETDGDSRREQSRKKTETKPTESVGKDIER